MALERKWGATGPAQGPATIRGYRCVLNGVAPNDYGGMDEHTSVLMNEDQAEQYRFVTDTARAIAQGTELAMAL